MTMVKTMMIRCGPLVVDAIPIQTWLSFPTRVQIFYHHVDVGHLSASFGKGQSFSAIVIVGHYRSLVQSVCWVPVDVSMRKRNSSS